MNKNIFTLIISSISLLLFSPAYASDQRQIECLARNAYFEARGEGIAGMQAVSHVVMNRVEDNRFPSTPCEVIYQRKQFSWTSMKNRRIVNNRVYEIAMDVSRRAFYRISRDNTRGSKFFHNTTIPRKRYIIRIGNHIFY